MSQILKIINNEKKIALIFRLIYKYAFLCHMQEGLVISSHAANTLSSFCSWSKGQNIEDDKNPDHFDHATLISR